jgi:hypothetical protein
MVVVNCRKDRVDRTEQFARDVLPNIKAKTLLLIGEVTTPITCSFKKGELPIDNLVDMDRKSAFNVHSFIQKASSEHKLMYGIGNIHGTAEEVIGLFGLSGASELHEAVARRPEIFDAIRHAFSFNGGTKHA